MPGGRTNIGDKLQPWKHNPNREMLPPEPNYGADADRFAERMRIKAEKKKIKELQKRIKNFGGRQSKTLIKDLNFTITRPPYNGKPFGYVLKRDKVFISNLIMSGNYEVSEEVARLLIKRRIV